MISR
jgi:hypothetical protein